MNEAASGVDVLSGQGEQAAPPAAPQETGNAPWYGEIEGDLKGWVENKGWKTPQDALNSAWNLEKMFGADKAGNTIVRPKEGDDEALSQFYNQLGRPEAPEQYKYEMPEGGNEDNLNKFREIAHRHGLTQDQFKNVVDGWDEVATEAGQAQELESKQKMEAEFSDLKKEWGLAYDQNVNLANRAASKFGFTQDEVEAMRDTIGPKSMMNKLAAIGKAMGEDQFVSGETAGEFKQTPAAAQSQIADLQMDKNFMDAYFSSEHPGHKAAVEKMTKLQRLAHPG